ncbi:Exopolysaccharide biosynthesis protein [Microbacterium sp. ru370.1]|uniref:phosphodiester glycosidase family protein n=1 Tax=unclassified Microbacterium TaxID=2609290 RepID=UPI00088737B9|nr:MULTISPECIES: phosphodiester glycosidase family protein [unclassified Microbacterium]SDO49807.1 Exopolysaccharide biosynthesis protein [Microbacterium sp. ru370.1]SIT82867.1 Exopolysaccharide biosynthesis protein [Microbacterium sp. RU1D]
MHPADRSPDTDPIGTATDTGATDAGATGTGATDAGATTAPPARRVARRTFLTAGLAAVLGAGGAAWWAADRFLIPHVEVTDVAAYEAEHSSVSTSTGTTAGDTSATAPVVTDSTFDDGSTSVTLATMTTGTGSNTVTYYVADVILSDATALRSAFANNQFGENITQTTSEIAAANGAVFAINGDYYGFRSTGIEIRNGVAYRDEGAREGLAFYADGRVEVYDETQTSAAELVASGVWNTLSFGPAIVEGGQVVDGIDSVEVDTNVGNHSIQGDQPRTAVGVIDDDHLVFVVVDGRQEGYSEGVTLPELADIMLSLGATTAYNLDGGGSSTMYFNGRVVNSPSNGGERGTSDILYVAG